MITSSDSMDNVVAGLRAGADDSLVKPVRMVELVARLHSPGRRAEQSPIKDSDSPGGPFA
jgi:DNA-binding response OmpR family regulator